MQPIYTRNKGLTKPIQVSFGLKAGFFSEMKSRLHRLRVWKMCMSHTDANEIEK